MSNRNTESSPPRAGFFMPGGQTMLKHKSATGLKSRDFDFEIKAVEKDGAFSGYGSVFGVVDSYGEIVAPGSFADSLAERASKSRKVPVLWQHRSGEPIGVYEKLREDKTGLWVEGRLLVDEVARAKEAHALMKAGAINGLSIGYYVRADSVDEKTRVRTLTKLDLQEVSVVTFPANDEARVEHVKAAAVERALKTGELPSLKEFEEFLREAGFSKSQATAIAGKGLRELLRSESASDATGDVLAALQSFSLSK